MLEIILMKCFYRKNININALKISTIFALKMYRLLLYEVQMKISAENNIKRTSVYYITHSIASYN